MVMTAQRTDLVVAVAVEVGGGGGGAGAGCGGGGVGQGSRKSVRLVYHGKILPGQIQILWTIW